MRKRFLEETDIRIIETPDGIDVHRLIEMLLCDEPPFESKHEKGFRDAIIIETMLEHAKGYKGQHVIIAASDEVFSDPRIGERFEAEGVHLTVVCEEKDLRSAIDRLADKIPAAARYEQDAEQLLGFLKQHEAEIFEFVMSALEVSESFLSSGMQRRDSSVCVIRQFYGAKPTEVRRALPGVSTKAITKRAFPQANSGLKLAQEPPTPFSCLVQLDYEVGVRRFLPEPPPEPKKYAIDSPADLRDYAILTSSTSTSVSSSSSYSGGGFSEDLSLERMRLRNVVAVEGTVHWSEDDTITDLTLERVLEA